MYSSQIQLDRIQKMGDAIREKTTIAQARARDAAFFISQRGASRVAALGWAVAGIGATAAIASAVVTAAPVVAIVGVVAASAVAGAVGALSVTAARREKERNEAQAFLAQAKSFYAELHKAYTEVKAEQQNQSSNYNPSADLVSYQAQRTQMTQSSSSGARQNTSPTERNSSGPRLG